ncbi:MAG: flagellar type III secretion system pore protein FliP [Planctomycetaceae bacterium]|nr:flagellar type III secretion system pore protein FliP [Planctomycetaceae bacterium]
MTDPTTIVEGVTQADKFGSLAPQLQVAMFLGSLVLLSSLLVTLTSFTRIVIVLSFVRRALTTQEIPPNPVVLGMSLFLTLFTMGSTLEAIEAKAVQPYMAEQITGVEACQAGWTELRAFMLRQTRKADIELFLDLAHVESVSTPEDTPARVLVPAFVTSELKTAFIMGFCIYIPFLLVDLVVSVVLMSLGMMMMPPVVVSTPLKILLFVLVDGWRLIMQALAMSFG